MTSIALRLQLAQLNEVQAILDALKTDITIRLKEVQQCTDAQATAAMEATGINPFSGSLSEF